MVLRQDGLVICEDLVATTFAVIDVETTGLDPKTDRIVEIACLRVRNGYVTQRFSSLVDPEREIPARASAVHGIYDLDVLGAPTLALLQSRIRRMATDAVVVAHNARFDLGFLLFLADRPMLCTMMLARRLVEAPNYRNEGLREFLQLEPLGPIGQAHRAEADATVTAALLIELLNRYERSAHSPSLSGLLAMVSRPVALAQFAFGAHRGKSLRQIPTGYLEWIVSEGFENWPAVRYSAAAELARRASRHLSRPRYWQALQAPVLETDPSEPDLAEGAA